MSVDWDVLLNSKQTLEAAKLFAWGMRDLRLLEKSASTKNQKNQVRILRERGFFRAKDATRKALIRRGEY